MNNFVLLANLNSRWENIGTIRATNREDAIIHFGGWEALNHRYTSGKWMLKNTGSKMTFGEAIELIKLGKRVRRKCWVPATSIAFYQSNGKIRYNQYSGDWTISQEDIFSEDWEEVSATKVPFDAMMVGDKFVLREIVVKKCGGRSLQSEEIGYAIDENGTVFEVNITCAFKVVK